MDIKLRDMTVEVANRGVQALSDLSPEEREGVIKTVEQLKRGLWLMDFKKQVKRAHGDGMELLTRAEIETYIANHQDTEGIAAVVNKNDCDFFLHDATRNALLPLTGEILQKVLVELKPSAESYIAVPVTGKDGEPTLDFIDIWETQAATAGNNGQQHPRQN